jgi:hypothetical protein
MLKAIAVIAATVCMLTASVFAIAPMGLTEVGKGLLEYVIGAEIETEAKK